MNFNDYQKNLLIGGVHTNGKRHSFEAQDIIEHTWYDDPASTVVYMYDYTHDDEIDKNINLHPECSKTKIPVEIKYIVSKYRSLEKDDVDFRIMFKPSYKCNIPYYDNLFTKPTKSRFPVGLYLDKKDEDGIWRKWLVVSEADVNIGDFPTWSILPCNYRYQWVYEGRKQQMWGVERSQNSYNSGVWRDHYIESTDNQTKAILPYNDITKNLYYNDRLLVTIDLLQPIAWRVSKVEALAHKGNILYTFKEDEYDDHHDWIERDEDGNAIGFWANWFKETNLPHEKDKSQPYDIYAEINYTGAEPHIKVNGSYKKIILTYYDPTRESTDQTPGDWSYWIDDTEVGDLIKVLETDTPNEIKIKFLGDEEYLGKILTVKNTRDNIVGTLQLQIVSL